MHYLQVKTIILLRYFQACFSARLRLLFPLYPHEKTIKEKRGNKRGIKGLRKK